LIADQPPRPWGGNIAEAAVIGLVTAFVLPKSALAMYQALGRREPLIRIYREGLEVRLVGRASLDNLPHFLEWITLYWSLFSLQGFRTKRLRIAWADLEEIRLTGRASVRVLIFRGPFWRAREVAGSSAPPAADHARFDQQDFSVPMDEIAAAVTHFQQDEKQRGFLPNWRELS
jgi:hypothetical protein